jgi:CBS domain-containing protein
VDSEDSRPQTKARRWWTPSPQWGALLKQREEQVFLLVTLLIGALVGVTVVAFIVLTERFGARIDATGAAAWRRLVVPIVGSLSMGFLLFKYFPEARGSGVPQTKAALYARGGFISLRTMLGKFFGIITVAALKKAAADGLAHTKLVDLIGVREFPHLHSDHSLSVALERLGAAGVDALPVVSRADVHKLEGVVALQDVLKFYRFASQNTDDRVRVDLPVDAP